MTTNQAYRAMVAFLDERHSPLPSDATQILSATDSRPLESSVPQVANEVEHGLFRFGEGRTRFLGLHLAADLMSCCIGRNYFLRCAAHVQQNVVEVNEFSAD